MNHSFINRILKVFIRFYQVLFAPMIASLAGTRCRFYPSCSRYAVECLDKYTAVEASEKIIKRLIKCGPWHPGGVDIP